MTELSQLRDLADAQQKLIATLIEDKEALVGALRLLAHAADVHVELVDHVADANAAIARAEGRSS